MARLKPGQTIDAATAALRGVQPQIREATLPPDWRPTDSERIPEGAVHAGAGRDRQLAAADAAIEQPLVTIMVVVALVLLIACANIANLLLARADGAPPRMERAARARRARAGGSSRQLLMESLLLSAVGAVARPAGRALGQPAPGPAAVDARPTPSSSISRSTGACWRSRARSPSLTALLFGTAPAFRAAGVAPMEAHQGTRPRLVRRIAHRSRRAAWSSRRLRSRSSSSSPPACSCARSARWRTFTSASTATACCSSTSTHSGPRFRPADASDDLRTDPSGVSRRFPASLPRRCRSSRRSAAAPGTTGSTSRAAWSCRSAQRVVELQRDHARVVHDIRHAARRRPRHSTTTTRRARRPSSSSTRPSRRSS